MDGVGGWEGGCQLAPLSAFLGPASFPPHLFGPGLDELGVLPREAVAAAVADHGRAALVLLDADVALGAETQLQPQRVPLPRVHGVLCLLDDGAPVTMSKKDGKSMTDSGEEGGGGGGVAGFP